MSQARKKVKTSVKPSPKPSPKHKPVKPSKPSRAKSSSREGLKKDTKREKEAKGKKAKKPEPSRGRLAKVGGLRGKGSGKTKQAKKPKVAPKLPVTFASFRRLKEKDAPHMSTDPHIGIDTTPKKKIPRDRVLFLSPKTKKPLTRTWPGMEVLYGLLRGDTGALHVLHPEPQVKDTRLRAYLEKYIRTQGVTNFTLFTQKAKETVKASEVKKLARGQKVIRGVVHTVHKGKTRPLHHTRLSIPSTQRTQKAFLYRGGQRRADSIEKQFHPHTREELHKLLTPQVAVPDGRVRNIALRGKTISDSLKSVVVAKALSRLRPYEKVYYEWVVIYRDPISGEKITLPGAGYDLPAGARITHAKESVAAFGRTPFRDKAGRLKWIRARLSRQVRQAFTKQGVRFTEMFRLHQIEKELAKEARKHERLGNNDYAEVLQNQLERVQHPAKMGVGGFGPRADTFAPLYKEQKDGKRSRMAKESVTLKVRFTVEDDPMERRRWEAEQAEKKKRRKK